MINICIIDYGLGNVRSVKNAIIKLGADVCISSNKKEIVNASHLILPGVGSFESGMKGLKKKKSFIFSVFSEIMETTAGLPFSATFTNNLLKSSLVGMQNEKVISIIVRILIIDYPC